MIVILMIAGFTFLMISVRTGINPDGGFWFDFSWVKRILRLTNKEDST